MLSEWVWMQRALALAERGRGAVEPNPLVGAVIVQEGVVVGEGWHQRYGEAHAEINALAQAGARARGATLYVTLEPCCHWGKTPPCTEAVIKAGIHRVVAAMRDPFPRVDGGGIAQLRSAGIAVEVGLGETEARRLNAPYLTLVLLHRPYVHAKWAMSLDGKIATADGDSKWISGPASRERVHRLRGRMDGILIGIGTALADDPLLTARPPGPRAATRIVLDSHGRLPLSSQLVQTAREIPVLLAVASAPADKMEGLRSAGIEVLIVPDRDGRVDVVELLAELGRRRFTNLLVEGGGEVLGRFRDADLIDEVHVFIAPLLLGGSGAVSPIAGEGATRIAEGMRLQRWEVEVIAGDVLLHGWR